MNSTYAAEYTSKLANVFKELIILDALQTKSPISFLFYFIFRKYTVFYFLTTAISNLEKIM